MSSLLFLLLICTVSGETISNFGRKPWRWPDDNNNIKSINVNKSPFFHIFKHKFKIQVVEKVPTLAPSANCICVPYYQCDSNNTIITDGVGIIDVRIRQCTGELEVCCKVLNFMQRPPPSSMAPIVTPTIKPTTTSTRAPSTLPPTSPPTSPSTLPPTSPSTLPSTLPPTVPPTTTTTTTTTTTLSPTSLPYNCICVDRSLCNSNGFVIIGGEGIINPRQTQYPCPLVNQICCRLPTNSISFPTSSASSLVTTTTTAATTRVPSPAQNSCVCVKIYQCNANGIVIISGAGIINPRYPNYRQGQITMCKSDESCCYLQREQTDGQQNILPIGFPSGPAATNSAGINPRANFSDNKVATGNIINPGTSNECICVKSWLCPLANIIVVDPTGIIDSRFKYCKMADEVCCRPQGIQNLMQAILPGSNIVVIQNGVINTSSGTSLMVCGVPGPKCSSDECSTAIGETYFAEFPWMVAIILKQNGGSGLFLCGGSMINTRAVLTAAHCVLNRERGLLVARFGEWNTAVSTEPLPYQESEVQSIITHPNYYKGGLYHDVAVLILSTPVRIAGNVQPICLPEQGKIFSPGIRCLASGWGRSGFDGQYQTTLKKIDLPVIDNGECQKRLRTTRLGEYFQLHGSFMCAGDEMDKDTCTGDGGGPLVCPTSSGQYVQVGIVSWGINCGASNVPAVYADVAQHRQWINQQLANYGVS